MTRARGHAGDGIGGPAGFRRSVRIGAIGTRSTRSPASSTTSAFTWPASALDTWYGLPTYVMLVFGTVCGLW